MIMKQFLLFIPCLLLFAGCKTTPKADLTRFNTGNGPIYPAISVVTTSEELGYYSNRDAFLKALRESAVFKNVEVNNPYADFAMEVFLHTNNKSLENDAEGFTKAVVAGGTLGLVPVGLEFHAYGTIKLRYQGQVFDEFDIESVYKTNFSIFNIDSKDAGVFGSYRKSVEVILEQIEQRESFKKLYDAVVEEKKEGRVDA